jgi:hypothetical protein
VLRGLGFDAGRVYVEDVQAHVLRELAAQSEEAYGRRYVPNTVRVTVTPIDESDRARLGVLLAPRLLRPYLQERLAARGYECLGDFEVVVHYAAPVRPALWHQRLSVRTEWTVRPTDAQGRPLPPTDVLPQVAPSRPESPPPAYLEFLSGPLQGQKVALKPTALHLGRSKDNEVALSDPSVSEQHAVIEYDASIPAYVIRDCGSKNGVFVNGHQVHATRLREGCEVRLGDCRAEFHFGVAAAGTGDETALLPQAPAPADQPPTQVLPPERRRG